MNTEDNILVIKLGALGDFIQALGPMAAIRRHHPRAHITLLTTKPFVNFAKDCGFFNQIWIDERPRWFDLKGWMSLSLLLNSLKFTRVYDLQNNDRSCFYFKLFSLKNRPEWVGTARGASHRNTAPSRTAGHAFDGHVQTLGLAGIHDVAVDQMEWMKGDLSAFALKAPYVLLVPGCAPDRPEKRWPASHYGRLARMLHASGLQPVILGTQAEAEAARNIMAECPLALDLTCKTDFKQIATLARGAAAAVGNDTGPMHIIGATGCHTLVLFSAASNPVRHAPKGAHIRVLARTDLKDLPAEDVFSTLNVPSSHKALNAVTH